MQQKNASKKHERKAIYNRIDARAQSSPEISKQYF